MEQTESPQAEPVEAPDPLAAPYSAAALAVDARPARSGAITSLA